MATTEEETLTAEELAEEAGLALSTLRKLMGELNDTEYDLRAPKVPGERGRKYLAKESRAWIKAGHPTGKKLTRSKLSRTKNAITVTASAVYGPNGWTASYDNQETIAGKSNDLRRNLAVLAASKFGVDPGAVVVKLEIAAPEVAEHHMARLREIEAEVKKLNAERDEHRMAAVSRMQESGMTLDDIAAVFGLHQVRISQILSEARSKETSSNSN